MRSKESGFFAGNPEAYLKLKKHFNNEAIRKKISLIRDLNVVSNFYNSSGHNLKSFALGISYSSRNSAFSKQTFSASCCKTTCYSRK